MVLAAAPAHANRPLPAAGADTFDSVMQVILEVGTMQHTIDLEGPTTIFRNDPVPGTDPDPCTVELELVSMRLTGTSPFGEVVVTNRSDLSSVGRGTTHEPACVHPTDVFFDVFVQVDVEILPEPLINLEPVRVQANNVLKFPPLFDTHTHPPPAIPLFFASNPSTPVAMIAGNSTHTPVQRLTFSIDDARASAIVDPADLLDLGNPPVARIQKEALGLVAGDNLDALSYGLDVIDLPGEMTVYFSVDPDAVGAPNTGVDREAQNGEAEGDEFISNIDNTNLEVLDEEGIVLVPRPPAPGDDIDALTNQPTRAVDQDEDGTLDRPVFFSLEAGSPTLASLGASPGDILVFDPQVPGLTVYATTADMGLVPPDELDALCLMKPDLPSAQVTPGAGGPTAPNVGNVLTDLALISLAPGSPSLATLGVSPGDLLLTNFNGAWIAPGLPPLQYILASQIGLLASDNLDALKCAAESVVIPIRSAPGGAKTSGYVTLQVGAPYNDGDPDVDPPMPGNPFEFEYWYTINPYHFAFDFHGPFFLPGADAPFGGPVLDYRDLVWRNFMGDVCPDPHLHDAPNIGNLAFVLNFQDIDPDSGACGHGKLVKGYGVFLQLDLGYNEIDAAEAMTEAVLDSALARELGVSATYHRVGFLGTFSAGAGAGAGPAGGGGPGAVVIVSGTGRTRLQVTLDGAEGIEIGEPLSSLPVPLVAPEPAAVLQGIAALAAIAAIARRRLVRWR